MASSINASTSGAGGLVSTADASGVLNIQTAGTTAVNVDASQNINVSAFATATGAGAVEKFRIVGAVSGGASAFAQFRYTNDTAAAPTRIYKSRGTAINTYTAVQNGDQILSIQAYAADGTTWTNPGPASMNVYIDGTVSTGITPGKITFITQNASGASNVATEMKADGSFLFNSGYGSAAVAYGCRAWVNFNGTGTVAIRGSGNVSSITDNGTGDYTVNFTTAMPDANYAAIGMSTNPSVVNQNLTTAPTTSAYRIYVLNNTFNPTDLTFVDVAVFR